ncbi:RNA polymerase sigma-70 factor (ECF subfamily) [Thermomonospora umbrina]|uniref:RNA polymerase sigma-70 factor (ECF subfamily) n=1 Tax=Thermomonospora umbrina TaxID=111806 RepID=A0A3D9SQF0_9ACTN|nr:RNA polymerase sigma-70 factor (ECF subfamily) [Thermomonospora umbrina]
MADAFRRDRGRLVATMIRVTGDWDLAEECVQEAYTLALSAWRRDGVPDSPRAWLTTAARNRAVDRIRREATGTRLRALLALPQPDDEIDLDTLASGIADDRLRLIFTCCHPALAFESQVALALRTLCGLTTAEIARAFLVSEPTMAKRLVRVKHKIAVAGIPYRVPPAHLLAERTDAVLGVIYLLFNEGYAATAGPDLIRHEPCDAAVRLAALVDEVMPAHPEAAGLHALLLLLYARSPARVDATGALVPLEEQDRSRWNRPMIDTGLSVLHRAVAQERVGPYQLQALIAGCHATSPRPADTDWPRIVRLYDRLVALAPTPTVRLNRAIAVAMATGPQTGLDLLDELTDDLAGHHLLPAARADLLLRLGRRAEAREHYRQALAGTDNASERAHLTRRLAECEGR